MEGRKLEALVGIVMFACHRLPLSNAPFRGMSSAGMQQSKDFQTASLELCPDISCMEKIQD